VPDHENLSHFGYVKASGFDDRKASCIELILRALRSLNRESFHVSRNVKNFESGQGGFELVQDQDLDLLVQVVENRRQARTDF
jgi:hypothetical protein